uniref:Bm7625 n=2 Tax=Brugia malayi TaxID=6279 RepID=A0A0H5S265_BRUMA|nr:Bm7625 [Brugia malayi]
MLNSSKYIDICKNHFRILKLMEEENSLSLSGRESSVIEVEELQQSSSSEWCIDSEIRLFKKLLSHKPAGISKHFHMGCLVDYMNNVYEDEDTDFEDVLTSEDLHELTAKRNTTGRPRVFKPRYKIRPSAELIWEKLENMYDMKEIEKNEAIPDGLLEQSEFCLPEDDFGDLLRKKDELNRSFVAPQTSGSQSTLRRKQRDSALLVAA